MHQKTMNNYIIILASFWLAGCAPALIVGTTATIGTLTMTEKGVGGALTDTQISSKIAAHLFSKNTGFYSDVDVLVYEGEVLLTGDVRDAEMIPEAERLIWQVRGVKAVHNYLAANTRTLGGYAEDVWITTKAKNTLFFEQNVKSINYSVKTHESILYILGTAQDTLEYEHVFRLLKRIDRVKKIISLVKIKGIDPDC